MGKFRIIIEGEGPHHSEGGSPTDANKVAKDTVVTLLAMGHTVETADFEHGYDTEKAAFADGETLLEELAPAEAESGDASASGEKLEA